MDEKPSGRLAGLSEFQQRHSFVFLCGGLLLLLIIAPVLEKSNVSRELLAIITTFILLSSIYSVLKESRGLSLAMYFLGALNLFTIWWEYAFWSIHVALLHNLALIIFFLFMIIIILRQISRETSVNQNVIYGAVTVYLLLAFTWGSLFATLFLLDSGSFHNLSVPLNSSFSAVPFWYLSFFTITTMGYNEVAPASNLAKSLAVIEAIVGQLYLVLQVALLVGLRVSEVAAWRHERR